jgi:hypothetical protein
LSLACLLADIEKAPRDDVFLGLVCQPDTPDSQDINNTVDYCSKKFPTIFVRSSRGGQGWHKGSGELWCGAMDYFSDNPREHTSIFTFDGGDCVPLRNTWINDLQAEHTRTLDSGKIITGAIMRDFVHSHMITELTVWKDYPALHTITYGSDEAIASNPLKDTWETQFAPTLLPITLSSSAVCNSWNSYGIGVQGLRDRSKNHIWLHGYKDNDLVDKARELLLGSNSLNQQSMATDQDTPLGRD